MHLSVSPPICLLYMYAHYVCTHTHTHTHTHTCLSVCPADTSLCQSDTQRDAFRQHAHNNPCTIQGLHNVLLRECIRAAFFHKQDVTSRCGLLDRQGKSPTTSLTASVSQNMARLTAEQCGMWHGGMVARVACGTFGACGHLGMSDVAGKVAPNGRQF
jgi:hypothetical protein